MTARFRSAFDFLGAPSKRFDSATGLAVPRYIFSGVLVGALAYGLYRFKNYAKFFDELIPFFKHVSVEERFLEHVTANAKEGDAQSVLDTTDEWCWGSGKNWMMNIGDKKGVLLDSELKKKKPKIVLEVGAFCGYSATRIARLLPEGGHLYSIEFSPIRAAVATKLVEFAGLSDRVTILIGTVSSRMETLRTKYNINTFDFIFLDHVKELYKSDFQLLENNGFVASGTVVFADNCKFPGCPEYVAYIENNENYVTEAHDEKIEYDDSIQDRVLVSTRK